MRQRWWWRLAGQGDDLAELFRREVARAARTRTVRQHLLDRGEQTLARQSGEPVLGIDPTPSPLPDRVFIESQGLRNRFAGLTVGGAQHDLRPLDQAVGGFAASRETFQGAVRGSGVR